MKRRFILYIGLLAGAAAMNGCESISPKPTGSATQASAPKPQTTLPGSEAALAPVKAVEPFGSKSAEKPRQEIHLPAAPILSIAPIPSEAKTGSDPDPGVRAACKKIADKLASVGFGECMDIGLSSSTGRSRNGLPILEKIYPPKSNLVPLGRVLLLGGTHGDELTSVSTVFKWMKTLDKHHSGKFHWLVAPLVNPDGVLREQSIRGNAYGVDLNRNLPTPLWETRSQEYWIETGRSHRRYPGPRAASEPETKWLINVIDSFKPDVIVSVHAPLEHVDYDSVDRSVSPSRIGILYRNLMGVFPGSLGNYAGVQRNIPVITLELPHLWAMLKATEARHIWADLVFWLDKHVPGLHPQRLAKRAPDTTEPPSQ